MKRILFFIVLIAGFQFSNAQVGINNTDPKAQLDISAGATASEMDGLLIPRLDEYPTGVGADQDGMMLFITGDGAPTKGFYYWDNDAGPGAWIAVSGAAAIGNTLDEAYDQGGAGLGKAISATDGALLIQGEDGIVVTGTFGSGNSIDTDVSGPGTRMYFNPNKAAFRAGTTFGTSWNDANVGSYSVAFGVDPIASGLNSTAFGEETYATGANSTAFGDGATASEYNSTAFGRFTTASGISSTSFGGFTSATGDYATAFGFFSTASGDQAAAFGSGLASGILSTAYGASTASGDYATASGESNTAPSYNEFVTGMFATTYTPNSTTSYDASDRLFTIGNGADGGNRNNALTIFKNGVMNINDAYNMPLTDGTVNQVLQTDGAGQLSFVDVTAGGDTDWTVVGSDIERQSGDAYIGDTNTTDNDLYISDRIIDWDNSSFYLDPSETSSVDEINFSDGSTSDPSIRFNGDTNTGFFQSENDAISFSASAVEYLKFSPKGQIEFLNTGNSVFVGQNAGNNDDYSNNQNVGVGSSALSSNVDGAYNVGLGQSALLANLSGDRNVGVGYFAGGGITTGQFNVAVGSNSLTATTEGESNIALGYRALTGNIDGDDNIAIGDSALPLATASDNIAIGSNSAQAITSGDRNIGIGYRAQAAHTVGSNNIAIGYTSLDTMNSLTNNSNNVAIGNGSMTNLTEASNNVAIGHLALVGSGNGAPNFADENVAIGTGAGQTNEGNGNVFIGYEAGQLAGVSDNKLYIENSNGDEDNALIYGEFDNNILRTNGELQIGNPSATGYALPTNQGTAAQVLTTNGDGTTAWAASSPLTASNGLTETSGDIALGGTLTSDTTISLDEYDLNFSVTDPQGPFSVNTNALVVENTNDVGIGVANPNYRLDVQDSSANFIASFTNENSAVQADGIRIQLEAAVPNASGYYAGFYRDGAGVPSVAGRISGSVGGVNYLTTSDRRLKTSFVKAENALATIEKMVPTWYEYKTNRGEKELGFIAQDLIKIFPQAVAGEETDDVLTSPMMVDYSRLTPVLTAGINELNEKVKKLEMENEALKQQLERLTSLEARLLQLENK